MQKFRLVPTDVILGWCTTIHPAVFCIVCSSNWNGRIDFFFNQKFCSNCKHHLDGPNFMQPDLLAIALSFNVKRISICQIPREFLDACFNKPFKRSDIFYYPEI